MAAPLRVADYAWKTALESRKAAGRLLADAMRQS